MRAEAQQEGWIERLRAGDHAAFAQLVTRETGRLRVVLRRILKSEQDAEDCLQDVFLAGFRALPNFNGDASVSTWLHRIALNTALMRLRSLRRCKEHLLENGDFDKTDASITLELGFHPWRPADPETALAQRQTEAFVASILDQISEEHRSVLMLRDFEELNTAQAAAKLGTKPDALKMRLHRARASLREVVTSDRRYLDTVRPPATPQSAAGVAAA